MQTRPRVGATLVAIADAIAPLARERPEEFLRGQGWVSCADGRGGAWRHPNADPLGWGFGAAIEIELQHVALGLLFARHWVVVGRPADQYARRVHGLIDPVTKRRARSWENALRIQLRREGLEANECTRARDRAGDEGFCSSSTPRLTSPPDASERGERRR